MSYSLINDWSEELSLFPATKLDVYFTPQYIKLYESDNEEAICFKYEKDGKLFLFPFLKREFNFEGKKYFDFETAYGYSGPIANTDDAHFIEDGLIGFYNYCKDNYFICGLTRFHPLLENSVQFDKVGDVFLDRQTVVIDLTKTENEIWMNSINGKNRSAIKKSISNNLHFEADYSFSFLKDFIELYNNTMKKLDAEDFFVFDNHYYEKWIVNMPNSFLGVVRLEDRIISAAIFFYSDLYGHYHLAGSNPEYLSFNPNNFMLWEAGKELKRKGIKLLHLGGGLDSNPENSLLSFKSRFSPLRLEFKIGKLIFNKELHQQICAQWEKNNPEKAIKFKNRVLKYKY
jgi:serine/alanine adding enzyme